MFNIAGNLHEYHRAQLAPETVTQSMIVKHFNRYKWELPDEWDNVDHRFGATDTNTDIEQTERDIELKAVISDDEGDEEVIDDSSTQRRLRVTKRRRGVNDLEVDINLEAGPSQRRRML